MNSRTIKLALLCFAALALSLITATAAFAGDQDFTVVNKTGVEIHKLFVSPHSSDDWGEDILGKDTLDDGETLNIKFGRSAKAAHWDLKIEDEKGHSVTWENLNLLEISKVTLRINKEGKAIADVE
jgi:hypothetical protein